MSFCARWEPDPVEALTEIRNLYAAVILNPQERAASLRAVARLEELDIAEGANGTLTVTANYLSAEGRQRYTVTLDAAGWLIRETLTWLDGVPGTSVTGSVTEYDATYEPPEGVSV